MSVFFSPERCHLCGVAFEPSMVEVSTFGRPRSWVIEWGHTHHMIAEPRSAGSDTDDETQRHQAEIAKWEKVADDLYLIHDDCPKDLTTPQPNSHEWNEIINNYFEAKGID